MNLKQMQESASLFQSSILNESEDWKEQIKQIWKATELVTEWQRMLVNVFGTPTQKDPDPIRTSWRPRIYSGDILPAYPVDLQFDHACIIQVQEIQDKGDYKNIHYIAELRIDENVILQKLLPKTTIRSDPIYKLIEINIKVPKQELVRDSIHLMNEKLEERETYNQRQKEYELEEANKEKRHWWN